MKTIIVDVAPPGLTDVELDHRMDELESLVSTYGGVTIVKRVQKKLTPDYKTFLGSGKLDEIMEIGHELGAELLIIGNIMKPAQVWNVNEYLRRAKSTIQAWDRIDLILKIFALHAISPESKLQIELASIKHMGPRIYGMGMELSRQGGGSRNAKGQGETNTEIMKRHLKEKEEDIYFKLKTYERTRSLHRESRKRKGLKTFGIVGYTNAGKSSLFNILTKKGVLAEDKLFATLGTSVGKVWIENDSQIDDTYSTYSPQGNDILINDTIGFIRDLPPTLIQAFTSTLEDSIESDILFHVIDASDLWIDEKIEIVEETLRQIGAKQPRWYIFNKIDLISEEQKNALKEKYINLDPIFLSAHSERGIDTLKKRISHSISLA
ncbi:GTPase HflX [Candidatus Gracilibacteria bacterium]|nr:GTPase HflX [Candidatus Gracilibacteria bacterium]